jgi:hypothetical protein
MGKNCGISCSIVTFADKFPVPTASWQSSSSSLPKLYVSSSSGVSSLPNFDSHSKVFPSPKAHWKLVVFVALTLNSHATDFSSQE